MQDNVLRVGITHGDYNGVGYEVILKALSDPVMTELCTPVVYGSAKIANFYRKSLDLTEMRYTQVASAAEASAGQVNVVNVIGEDARIEPGNAMPEAGAAAVKALEAAVSDLRNGDIDVLVTAPINKNVIHGEEFAFPGHTEYLEARLGTPGADKAMMIMCSDRLRVALVTIHEALADVPGKVTKEAIVGSIKAFAKSLVSDFGIHKPRIAVLSLNPHVGDGGVIGAEDDEVVRPAIQEAYADKVLAFGPYASDGFFGSGAYSKFDGVLAMYHDQGLTPFKLLSESGGVNFTAGLPYVRTSPDHGTAYDIAGKGVADAQSMRDAIYAAVDIYRRRQAEADATANPLKKTFYDKGSERLPGEKRRPKDDNHDKQGAAQE